MKKITLICILFCFMACTKETFEWYHPFAYEKANELSEIHYYYINDNNVLKEIPKSGTFSGFEENSDTLFYFTKLEFIDKDKVAFNFKRSNVDFNYTLNDSLLQLFFADPVTGYIPEISMFELKFKPTAEINRVTIVRDLFKIRWSFKQKNKQKYDQEEYIFPIQNSYQQVLKTWKYHKLKPNDTIAIYHKRTFFEDI